jgi:translation initiation factor 1
MADNSQNDPPSPSSRGWRSVSFGELLAGRNDLSEASSEATPEPSPHKKGAIVKLGRETKGRRGKGVTTISDVPLDATALGELATKLKGICGCGGTVKDGVIEIQGDQRERLAKELEKIGYRVKRVGG